MRQAERYNWAATRGVNEEILMENLPEDLQRDIRRHLFKFVKKVSILEFSAISITLVVRVLNIVILRDIVHVASICRLCFLGSNFLLDG